ncbi:anthraniloyl-CoA monooxygenase [Massilia aurea]|uniref:Anthraniloyl-CoA monooxygenase n=1 Tax=Massilia aurea TaxID=373040 RepID=A0A7W9WZC1_9BURK|nr:bifunctional salicylyl-CoA 5-hydroxylase/oxidoreductase [Massilia aurea]MBB6133629.1 anthraniloyl-CoA monooxygenase [Massilia aurea]
MNIVCVGGGPAGLYAGLLMKLRDPRRSVTVVERNQPGDTFGWGVVFSDQTLGNLALADAPSARAIEGAFNRWDAIDVQIGGATVTSHGHGFCGIARKRLLGILQARCEDAGVALVFDTDVTDEVALARRHGADLVVAADGVHSAIRTRHAAVFRPDLQEGRCRYVWLGTRRRFAAFTFAFAPTEHGWFQAHAYQYDDQNATFIVETLESTWRASGLADMDAASTLAFCERLFANLLGGAPLLTQASRGGAAMWHRFARLTCREWVGALDVDGRRVPLVLLGDAAHTAHFSIGSGTKLALEDAIALAAELPVETDGDLNAALLRYQAARVTEVSKLQSAARNSTEWFENVARYSAMPPDTFAYSLLTRSQRLSHENLRLRDPAYIQGFERRFAVQAAAQAGEAAPTAPTPPMFTPLRVRDVLLKNRVVVSPMAQYACVDGVAGDFHLAHLGARALGGAGLVIAEMTCVSADARITPRCPGLYLPEHTRAWARIVDFVHAASDAKIGIQLGHAGAKGSTRPMWEGIDQPLAQGNWPLVAASPQRYLAGVSQVARQASEADMAQIEADFVRATLAASEAGFDWLELHCAHGYLLSSFISPLTNRRGDDYGGSLENRCRFPLRVFAAVRAAWPAHLPISVRISSHDWVDGGITPMDAVEIARLFRAAGADMIDCSSGQVSKAEQPVYGRMYQTPFSDRIRNEAGIATIAVGGISEADHVNSIIAAGRADLCAVGRGHLANPAWTLNEAARIGYTGAAWPRQYAPGKQQLERTLARGRSGT